jgi:hypothetical protein
MAWKLSSGYLMDDYMQTSNILPYVVDVGFSEAKNQCGSPRCRRGSNGLSSIKFWKRYAHKRERQVCREALRKGEDPLTHNQVWASWDLTD